MPAPTMRTEGEGILVSDMTLGTRSESEMSVVWRCGWCVNDVVNLFSCLCVIVALSLRSSLSLGTLPSLQPRLMFDMVRISQR
jgi:hypothetical protein